MNEYLLYITWGRLFAPWDSSVFYRSKFLITNSRKVYGPSHGSWHPIQSLPLFCSELEVFLCCVFTYVFYTIVDFVFSCLNVLLIYYSTRLSETKWDHDTDRVLKLFTYSLMSVPYYLISFDGVLNYVK